MNYAYVYGDRPIYSSSDLANFSVLHDDRVTLLPLEEWEAIDVGDVNLVEKRRCVAQNHVTLYISYESCKPGYRRMDVLEEIYRAFRNRKSFWMKDGGGFIAVYMNESIYDIYASIASVREPLNVMTYYPTIEIEHAHLACCMGGFQEMDDPYVDWQGMRVYTPTEQEKGYQVNKEKQEKKSGNNM